jgi:voltage-gated potassium channel Kch
MSNRMCRVGDAARVSAAPAARGAVVAVDLLTSIGISIVVTAVLVLLAHRGDVFLLGVSREGLALVQHLDRHAPGLKSRIVAIDFNPEMLERLGGYGIVSHYGDIANAETLRHAGIERATMVISGISDWFLKGTSNLHLLRQTRGLAPAARVMVTADSAGEAERLYAAGADYVLLPAALTAEHLEHILTDDSPEALTRARRRQAGELIGG